ncbi:TPM domain-containing protein [Acutalibacter caecimuris]|uniref:TPM domain-containing protein n=1 Tax=Acutalibacter caecimuris TaxID=3093657 RepID=UPI002AC9EC7D|nr:TPM domain-containing protein [Acutalibacter sp. M00118]
MKKRSLNSLLGILLALCLVASLAPSALAAIPKRPENKYVLDSAGVLSSSTEKRIISTNQDLFAECGAEVVVVAVDFFGGKSREDYATDLFNQWGIGSSERNNGILLLLGIGEDDYYAQAGYGIEDYFNGGMLGDMLYDYLEEDFAAGDYDAGVLRFFDAVVDELESYYAGSPAAPMEDGRYEGPASGSSSRSGIRVLGIIVFALVRIAIVVVVLLLVFRLLKGIGRGGGPRGGGGGGGFWQGMFMGSMMNNHHRRRHYWGPPPPPPPPYGGPRPPRPGGFGGRPGGFGGFGEFGGRPGGFSGGGGSRGGGAGRGFGGGRSGGFHGGGGSRGGGAGRR